MPEPALSLVICTYRRPGPVERLLRCLREQEVPPDEVLVVDASPDGETEAAVLRLLPQWPSHALRYFRAPPEHRGLTRQRNYGVERARGGIVAFLDDDTLPEPPYFREILACFARHPEAAAVAGHITNEVEWTPANGKLPSLGVFRWGEWERREDYRWRLRRLLGLASPLAPGWMPEAGHGRPVGFLPPDDRDYPVETAMGGTLAVRADVVRRVGFSPYFSGYGLYEDADFCLRAAREGPLFLCTRARLAHYHAPAGRPAPFRYGVMVVRNGWYVWRRRWPSPAGGSRARWWAVTLLLTFCRLGDALRGPGRGQALAEAAGRLWGMASVLLRRPPVDVVR